MLTPELIRRFAPNARPDIVAGLVAGWPRIHAAGIDTPKRLQHFMAETGNETGLFTTLEENLNYSATRIRQVWPSRFRSIAAAKPFAHNPRALANKVYGGRMGNVEPDDGWRYRGGGLIQTTGRSNYRKAGFEHDPDAVRRMPGALDAALEFWTRNRINPLVDAGDLAAERRKLNGGRIGLENVRLLVNRAGTMFTHVEPPLPAAPVPPPRRAPGPRPATIVEPQPPGLFGRLLAEIRGLFR